MSTTIVFVFHMFVGNHKKMLLATGYKAENIKDYRYFDEATKGLDFQGMWEDLEVKMQHNNFCAIETKVIDRAFFFYLKREEVGVLDGKMLWEK